MWIPRLFTVISLYIMIVVGLIVTQPACMFDVEGHPKPFGLGFADGKSVFAPCVMFPLIGILMYILVIWFKLMTKS